MCQGAYNIVGYPVDRQQVDNVLYDIDISDIRPNVVGRFLPNQEFGRQLEGVSPRSDFFVREQQERDLKCLDD